MLSASPSEHIRTEIPHFWEYSPTLLPSTLLSIVYTPASYTPAISLLAKVELFIEILLKSREFVFAKDAALPPGAEEAGAVAGELDERGGH